MADQGVTFTPPKVVIPDFDPSRFTFDQVVSFERDTPAPKSAQPTFDPSSFTLDQVTTFERPKPAAFDRNSFTLDQVTSVERPPSVPGVYTLAEFRAKTADDLKADKAFSQVDFVRDHGDELLPEDLAKLTAVYKDRETRGTTLKEKLSAFANFPAVADVLRKGVVQAAKTSLELSPAGVGKRVIEAGKSASTEPLKQTTKSVAELAASVETAGIGTADLLRRSGREIGEGVGKLPAPLRVAATAAGIPSGASKAELSDQEWRDRLLGDAATAKQVERAGQGNGAVMEALNVDADTLKQSGIVVNPEVIQDLSVITDPINYIPFGATVGFVGKIAGKVTRGVIATTVSAEQAAKFAQLLNRASEITAIAKSGAGTVAGIPLKIAGAAIEKTGQAAEKAVKAVGGVASGLGLGGILGHDIYSAVLGGAIAKGAPAVVKRSGQAMRATGEILAGQRAVPAVLSLAGQTVRGATSGALKGVAEGAILALPFEIGARPEEEQVILGGAGLGGVLRSVKEGGTPAAKATARATQERLAETIYRRVQQTEAPETPDYNTHRNFDEVHKINFVQASESDKKVINWGRRLLNETGGQIYVDDGNNIKRITGIEAGGYAVDVGERINPDGTKTPVVQIFLNKNAEHLSHEFLHALEYLDPKNAKGFKDSVATTLTPEQFKSFESDYNSRINSNLPESQWKYRLPKDKVISEVAAEMFSRVFNAQDLSGVNPQVTQKAALFISSILEKLGVPLQAEGLPSDAPGASNLGLRPGTDTFKEAQTWLKNIVQSVNERGTFGPVPLRQGPSNLKLFRPEPVLPQPKNPPPVPPLKQAELFPKGVITADQGSQKDLFQGPDEPKPKAPEPPAAPVLTQPKPKAKTADILPPVATPVNPPSPVASAPRTTARNIRTTRAKQDDFAGQRAEVTNIELARTAAAKVGDQVVIDRVEEIIPLLGTPLEIEHSGVKSKSTAENPLGRTPRQAEREAGYIAEALGALPANVRDAHQKVLVPVRFQVVKGQPLLENMSLDKIIANAHFLAKESAKRKLDADIPYELSDAGFTDASWRKYVDAVGGYTANQANGLRGDGQRLVRPGKNEGISIPAENPDYVAVRLSEDEMNFINATMGIKLDFFAREGGQSSAVNPGNVKGQILAELNQRTPEIPAVIRPKDLQKQTFKSGRVIKETNPLRNKLAAAGVPIGELIPVTERIYVRDMSKITPRPDINFNAPVTDTIRGGFAPGKFSPPGELEGSFSPAKNFSADDDPITAAAIRTSGNRIFTGSWHGEAVMNLVDAVSQGKLRERFQPDPENPGYMDPSVLTEGFVTRSGKFLNREEALRHAETIGQLNPERPDLKVRGLESADFERRKKEGVAPLEKTEVSPFDRMRAEVLDDNTSTPLSRTERQAQIESDRKRNLEPNRYRKRGKFSPGAESDPFYSRLTRTVEQSQQGKGSGSQWKATIKNSKLGANADEMSLVGLHDLEDGKTYTKSEVLEYLRANEVVVKDVTLGETTKETYSAYREDDGTFSVIGGLGDQVETGYGTLAEAETSVQKLNVTAGDISPIQTHFSTYQLPGAIEGSYREVLLTVPGKEKPTHRIVEDVTEGEPGITYSVIDNSSKKEHGPFYSRESAEKFLASRAVFSWRDGHSQYSDVANPIVRLRFNERTRLTYTPEQIADIGARLTKAVDAKSENSLGSGAPGMGVRKNVITPIEAAQYSHAKGFRSDFDQSGAIHRTLFLEEVQAPQKGEFEKMPALFQKNWREVAFKWALRHAAENGFDSIGWTTGEQQAARYDLSKQLSAVNVTKNTLGDFNVTAEDHQGEIAVRRFGVEEGELESLIGKELAVKAIAQTANESAHYAGLDLKVGGEGLKKLYDQDFRNVVNNLPAVKKSGQKVGTATIEHEQTFAQGPPPIKRMVGDTVHSLDISQSIRESVMGGQGLFSPTAAEFEVRRKSVNYEPKKKAGSLKSPTARIFGPRDDEKILVDR